MTLGRRLARVEAALTPSQAVLAWLAEAQAYPSVAAYVASLVAGPASAWPLVRIPRQVEAAVRAEHRNGSPGEVIAVLAQARADVASLIELVLAVNLGAEHAVCEQAARVELLERHAGGRGRPWRADVGQVAAALELEARARAELEMRYLGGRPVLFPGVAAAWSSLRERVERLVPGAGTSTRRPSEASVRERVAGVVAQVNVAALQLLGERAQAVSSLEAARLDSHGRWESRL